MKTKKMNRWLTLGALGITMISSVTLMGTPAEAKKSKNWKKATIAGAAVTGYGLVKGKGRVATVGAAATAGSYHMQRKARKDEQKEARRRNWYQNHYGRNWRNHYPG